MACKDCVHYDVCMDFTKLKESELAQNIDVAEHLCDHFKNKADFVEVVRMDEKEISKIKKAISMIDDYLQEPNSIAEDWVMVLKLCRQALREKVDG